VLLIGDNASGKTSLLLTILDELNTSVVQYTGNAGRTFIYPRNTRAAYCGHDSWIMNASVKENILIAGDGNNAAMYNDVIKSISLQMDINEWKDKDFTLLGEKGSVITMLPLVNYLLFIKRD